MVVAGAGSPAGARSQIRLRRREYREFLAPDEASGATWFFGGGHPFSL